MIPIQLYSSPFIVHEPYQKQNANIVYVSQKSNHPPIILKNIPQGIEKRLVKLSSNADCFNEERNVYQSALDAAGYDYQLNMTENNSMSSSQVRNTQVLFHADTPEAIQSQETIIPRAKRYCQRKIIYFNPPFNCYVKNNVGKYFLSLLEKHFKKGTFLGKLFNRNNVKISYSCCPKMQAHISSHNKKLLQKEGGQQSEDRCNCRDKNACPMQGSGPCNVGSVVYRATLTAEGSEEMKYYIGSSNNFKLRYGRHKQAFNNGCSRL